jgi:hypothetical protein
MQDMTSMTFLAMLQRYVSLKNPFSDEVSDDREKLKVGSELQYDTVLRRSFNQ